MAEAKKEYKKNTPAENVKWFSKIFGGQTGKAAEALKARKRRMDEEEEKAN
jgi:hypothetical protein